MEIVKSKYEQYIGSNLWKIGTAFLSLVLVTGFLLCFAPTVSAFAVSYILTPLGILISLMYLLKIKSWFSFESGVVLALAAWLFITRIVKTGKLFSFANEGTVLYVSILLICFLLGYTTLKEEQKKAISILAWVTVTTVVIFDIVGLSAVFFTDGSIIAADAGLLGFIDVFVRLYIIDHPNIVGMNTAIAIIAAVFLIVNSKAIVHRILAVLTFLIFFPVLAITFSRNSYLSLAISIGIFAFVEILIYVKSKGKLLVAIIGALIGIILIILTNRVVSDGMSRLIIEKKNRVNQTQSAQLNEDAGFGYTVTPQVYLSTMTDDSNEVIVLYRGLSTNGGIEGFLNGRVEIWSSALRVMANSSLEQKLMGLNGLNELKSNPFNSVTWANHTHNSIVNVTVLNGAVGLFLVMVLLCLTAVEVLQKVICIDKWICPKGLLAFCISIIGFSVLSSFVEINLFFDGWSFRNPSILWFMLAAGSVFKCESKTEQPKKSKVVSAILSICVATAFVTTYFCLLSNYQYHDLWRPVASGAACYSKSVSKENVAEQDVRFDGNEINFVLLKTGTMIDGKELNGDVLTIDIIENSTGEIVGTLKKQIGEVNISGYTSFFSDDGIDISKDNKYRVRIYTEVNEENNSLVIIEADYCDRAASDEKAYYNDEAVNEIYAISFYGK